MPLRFGIMYRVSCMRVHHLFQVQQALTVLIVFRFTFRLMIILFRSPLSFSLSYSMDRNLGEYTIKFYYAPFSLYYLQIFMTIIFVSFSLLPASMFFTRN